MDLHSFMQAAEQFCLCFPNSANPQPGKHFTKVFLQHVLLQEDLDETQVMKMRLDLTESLMDAITEGLVYAAE